MKKTFRRSVDKFCGYFGYKDQEREILPSTTVETPSATFFEALGIFRKFYKL